MSKIRVTWTPVFGGVVGRAVAGDWALAFGNHMRELCHYGHDGAAFVQGENPVEDLAGLIPPRKLRELDEGYPVTVLMDPYDFGMVLGYDACHVTLENSL